MSIEVALRPAVEGTRRPRPRTAVRAGVRATLSRWWTAHEGRPTIEAVLATWRLAERDLEAATPGSESWFEASERFLRARAEYQRLFLLAAVDTDSLRSPG